MHNRDNGFLIEFPMASEFQLRDDYTDASGLLNRSVSKLSQIVELYPSTLELLD